MFHHKADEIEKAITYYKQQNKVITETKQYRYEFLGWLSQNKAKLINDNDFSFKDTNLKVTVSNAPFDDEKYIVLIVGDEEFYSATMKDASVVKEIINGII